MSFGWFPTEILSTTLHPANFPQLQLRHPRESRRSLKIHQVVTSNRVKKLVTLFSVISLPFILQTPTLLPAWMNPLVIHTKVDPLLPPNVPFILSSCFIIINLRFSRLSILLALYLSLCNVIMIFII